MKTKTINGIRRPSTELMLAIWPGSTSYTRYNTGDSIMSFWLNFRTFRWWDQYDIDGERPDMDHNTPGSKAAGNCSLWVYGSDLGPNIALKAHDIYSANITELENTLAWLKLMNRRIQAADHPDARIDSYPAKAQLALVLNAMHITKAMMIEPRSSGNRTGITILPLAAGLEDANLTSALARIDGLKKDRLAA